MSSTDVLGIVSLIIAITAFIIAVAQALQQFAASAEGYRRCGKQIMGRWALHTRRVFTINEFRFKVVFNSPVLFVAPPTNNKGPIPNRDVHNVDGSLLSYQHTLCRHPSEQEADADAISVRNESTSKIQRVHTADDEIASWVLLLEKLQQAEADGQVWDRAQSLASTTGAKPAKLQSSLVVQVQEKRRSWDQMPDAIQKPFATSTISHLVEIAAMLGMIWRAFDQDSWNLRAEGNGSVLMSQAVWGLGISVVFAVTDKAQFSERRLIPCPAVKELLFGTVPTTITKLELQFEPKLDKREEQHLTRRMLKRLKCSPTGVQRYFKRRDHIQSINFEIIAMIGQVFRVRGSSFRRIPNPTPDLYNGTISSCKMMEEFQKNLSELLSEKPALQQVTWIQSAWKEMLQGVWKSHDSQTSIDMREAVHNLLEDCDKYIKNQGDKIVVSVVGAHLDVVLEEVNSEQSFLHSRECDTEEELWEYYFHVIRDRVVNFRSATVESPTSVVTTPRLPGRANVVLPEDPDLRENIWITLQFRMCCWSLLHEFDHTDMLILPARLKGSRLPVYIL